ncbi:MAG: hypothetical protein V4787_23620, partial [Pseudomonadota bacterium]
MNPSPRNDPGAARGSLISWLARLNTEVSQWASSMSWWRLIFLFLLLLIAGSIIAELLHLKHDRVRVGTKEQEMVVTIGGKDGIQIRGKDGGPLMIPPHPTVSPKAGDADPDDDDDKEVVVARKIITARGVLGDIGSALMVIFFAYLAAAKIVVRKVAQAD